MAQSEGAGWDGTGYAEHSAHHRAVDEWFLGRHRPGPDDVVVDLGCGSGEFSARLAVLVPGGRVIGVDPDPSMLARAAAHGVPNLELIEATAERLDEVLPGSTVDLVVSRAMLHWLPLAAYPRCFEAVANVLRPGGWFHSESGGAGNVAKVIRLLDDIGEHRGLPRLAAFPDAGVVFDLVEAAGFEIGPEGVRTVAQRRRFTHEAVIGLLRTQAAVALTRQLPRAASDAVVRSVVERADELRRQDGSFDLTFVRLEILARKPGWRPSHT